MLPGWPQDLGKLAAALPPEELLDLPARTDSALVWALVRHRLRAGGAAGQALAETCREIARHCDARLNLLLTDGRSIAATAWGDTLCYRAEHGRGVVVASEPFDDAPGWRHLPDRSLLLATPESQAVLALTSL
jgi:glutamine amidotransferase